jgi:hypothetical protein
MHLLLSLTGLLTLLGLSGGSWYLWSATPPAVIPSGKYIFAVAVALGAVGIIGLRRRPTLQDFAHPGVWSLGLVAVFFSSWLCRPYSFFQGPDFRREIAVATVVACALSFIPWKRLLLVIPIATSLWSIWTFLKQARGSILFVDDHAMFIFRLKLLKENFPSIPFWSPVWNAGIDARDFFATGALNAFALASPLVYLFPVESVYNIIIAGFLFVLAPASSYLAARFLNAERVVASLAAVLAMSSSLFWYRWALKYGTVGFIVSTSLMPLCVALYLRFISSPSLRWRDIALLTVSSTLMLLWSPSGIALLPLALFAIPHLATILSSRRHLITILLILAINLPWMTMMWKVSGVGKFLDSHASTHVSQLNQTGQTSNPYRHRSEGVSFKKSLKNWQEAAGSANPLVVILAIPAIISLARPYRRPYGAVCTWLLLLGTVGVSLKPQLELDRMLVIAGVLASFPIASLITQIFSQSAQNTRHRLTAAIVGGFLLASPCAIHKMMTNELFDKYSFAGPEVQKLSDSIATLSHSGRGLFTGCVLHQLSEGHLAPLPLWSKTPLIASSYAHNIWKYQQPIPESFLQQREEGIPRFFDLMNVTLVMAHEADWRTYFLERPHLYAEKERHQDFIIFERKGYTPSYVLEGAAQDISQNSNSVTFTPLSDRVVLKFKYFPFLESSGCMVTPYDVAPDLSLVELSGCPIGKQVILKSVSPARRLVM